MSYLVLARKYRPQTFEQVVGQAHVTRTLTNAITSGRVAHAILFSGPRGTGKTTVARILAKAMNCEKRPTAIPCNVCRSCSEITSGSAVDVFEIDGASNNGVDQVRELRENVKYMPAHSPHKIYIIDEVHMLSVAAFNALLKTLEEPPAHILFLFATTEVHKIPSTILSRCQRHDFRRIDVQSITAQMQEICDAQEVEISAESLWLIAREAQGSMRDALSLLDQLMAGTGKTITQAQLIENLGIIDRRFIFAIADAVLGADPAAFLDLLDEIYDRGHDMKKLYADLLEHFRNLLVLKIGKSVERLVDLPAGEIELIGNQVKDVSATYLSQLFDLLFREEAAVRFATQPRLALEMIFIKMLQTRPVLPIDDLIVKLDLLRREFHAAGISGDPGLQIDSQDRKKKNDQADDPSEGEVTGGSKTSEDFPEVSTTADDLAGTWEKCLERLGEQNPILAANLRRSKLNKMRANELEVVAEGNGFNRSIIMRAKNVAVLKKVCREYFGQDVELNINVRDDADQQRSRKNKHSKQIVQEALSHPLVADVIQIFNGKVVDVKLL